jgi:predicted GIY-YIG superfamily endonuclease
MLAQQKNVVYALTKPDGSVFYIGQTRNPHNRLQAHRCKFGKDISLKVLQDEFVDETPCDAEFRWIKTYEAHGKLANVLGTKEKIKKEGNPLYSSHKVLIKREIYSDAMQTVYRNKMKLDFSEVVERLLIGWIEKHKP